jgi:transcriptional regulator with XRE-family HTH domain
MSVEPSQIRFGIELRRRRIEAGLSLTALAESLNYSKSHVSKIESGAKLPSVAFARRCDHILQAGGELGRLVRARAGSDVAERGSGRPNGLWLMRMTPDGVSDFQAFAPQALSSGQTDSILSSTMAPPLDLTRAAELALPTFQLLLAEIRQLGQSMDPAVVTQILVVNNHWLRLLAGAAPIRVRQPALRLAGRFAEFTGWMAQESGDEAASLWWTRHAVQLAGEAGDRDLATYALVRRAELAMFRHDALTVVNLARRAQDRPASPRVHSLAAQREAQGHALAGDDAACWRALDRARELMQGAPADPGTEPVLGTATTTDPLAFATAWCLFELGNPELAADTFAAELDRLPAQAHRARARYGARLALSLAAAGDIARACQVAEPVLATAGLINSATIRHDLRDLARTLNRRPHDAAVRDISVALTAAVQANLVQPLRYDL